ncbi:MAG: hypothetical protein WCJ25_01590 [Candidatus Moraniibacteriota bacterium]
MGSKKIYTSNHYHFSFSYPVDLTHRDVVHGQELQKDEIITDTSVGHTVFNTILAKDALAEVVNDGVSIDIRRRENTSANAFPTSLQGDQGAAPTKREETKVGGAYAVHYIDSGAVSTGQGETQAVNETYVVEKDGYVYTIGTFGSDPAYRDVLKEIVDSFSFLGTESDVSATSKHYENAKYGFSLDMPKDFWFEENTDNWDVGPVFSVDVEHPALKPDSKDHPDGTTTMSKYGILLSVSVCDRSLNRGKCPVNGKIDGMDFKRQSEVSIGGLTAQKFDDKAYVVLGKKYDYEIILNPSLADSLSVADLKGVSRLFEDIVKTVRFK